MDFNKYNLTTSQESIFAIEQFYENSPINNIAGLIMINQDVQEEKLKEAITKYIKDNDNFKIKLLKNSDSKVKQYFDQNIEINIDTVKVKNEEEIKKIANNIVNTPYELFDSPLFRFKIFKLPDNHGGFIICTHHLIADAWTAGLVVSTIIDNYNFLVNNTENINKESFSYIDYIDSEKQYLESQKYLKDKEFWKSSLSNLYDAISLPESVKSPKNQSLYESNRKEFLINKKLLSRINEYCSNNKVSLFAFFLAIYSIYLGRVNNLENFIIGTPVLNRSNFKEKNTSGLFISTIPFPISLNWNTNFKDLITQISIDTISNFRHQKYPYQHLLEDIREKDSDIPNLYNILYSYQNVRSSKQTSDIDYSSTWVAPSAISNDMQIHIHDMNDDDTLIISYDYKISKYTTVSINDFHKRILYIIEQILDESINNLSEIEIVTPDEQELLLDSFNNTKMQYNKNISIHSLIEKQAQKTPNKIAVISNNEKITYKELNEKSNQLALYLRKKGAKPNTFVGIICNRSVELIIGLLGILKSGAAYLPIDPEYPKDRISYMLEDSSAKLVVIKEDYSDLIPDDIKKINIKDKKIYKNEITEITNINTGDDLAYIIYTSGSTGKPKGVKIRHRNINNFILGTTKVINFSKRKTIVSVTTVCFDIFVLESFLPLQKGLTIVLANELEQNDPKLLNKLCINNKVNIIQTTPSRLKNLVSDKEYCEYVNNLTDILIGGEPLPEILLQYLQSITKKCNIYNMYGPTETTVWSTIKNVTRIKNISIGKPISNTSVYVLDEKTKKLLPPNSPGILYIGGDGVCGGYHNREDLNKKLFINNPYKNEEIIYNTNDLVKQKKNGDLIHLGRGDFQVKLRGYRIELGEIENKVFSYPNISEAVVVAKDSKYLICYYTSKADIIISDLISFLLEDLPNYMIPAYFIKLDKMPLTPNGKIDRKKLPKPGIDENISIEKACTDTQKLLEKNILKILNNGMESVDINTPFISLGLDSLSIIQLQSILLQYQLNLTTQTFYKYPTIKKLASYIDNNSNVYKEKSFEFDDKFLHSTDEKITDTSNNLGNVFLTGANGFIGIHVLHELLKTTDSKVYCLVRGANDEYSCQRLRKAYRFYFKSDINRYLNKRVFIINGDIVEEDLGLSPKNIEILKKNVTTVIHTAAVVKHYGNFEEFKSINIEGTRHIVDFSYNNNFRFIHISSISISGNYLLKQNNRNVDFSENNLYIGQHYTENVYVNSKLESENIVYSYMKKGLIGKVLRIGIISGRRKDGVFQENISANAFYSRIKSLVTIGAASSDLLNQYIEFTPIDECATAIVLLAKTDQLNNKVFHLYNHNLVCLKKVIQELKKFSINISILSTEEFRQHILKLTESFNEGIKAIVNDFNTNNLSLNYNFTVNIKSDFTQKALKQLGFEWKKIDREYLHTIIKYMRDVNFI